MRSERLALGLWLLSSAAGFSQARESFRIGGHEVAPGKRADVHLSVAAGASDPSTYVPVSVFHGAADGPVLAITMGVHGYEFAPILAGQILLDRIDASSLKGTVLLVRIAHVEAFEGRVPYVNPHDRKNLNRVFPGRTDGTQSERIAATITAEVIRRSDVHVEVHGGDGAEWLEAFVGIYGGTLAAAQYPRSREVGLAFRFENVVKYSMDRQEQVDRGRSLNRQAVADGKPTVLVEIGENGRRDAKFVEPIVAGVENLLVVLSMKEGSPKPPREDTRWLDDTIAVAATRTGIFTPVESQARRVRKGDVIGTVTDYAGRLIETITSPVDGYAMDGLAGPPVRSGETVVTIGLPAEGPL